MQLIDSNIIIYSSQPTYSYLRSLIQDPDSYASQIAYVETLGYHKITPSEKKYLESVFQFLKLLPFSKEVMQEATRIRQFRKFSLGDSIHSATALVYDLDLYTRNVEDFQQISELRIFNPLT